MSVWGLGLPDSLADYDRLIAELRRLMARKELYLGAPGSILTVGPRRFYWFHRIVDTDTAVPLPWWRQVRCHVRWWWAKGRT